MEPHGHAPQPNHGRGSPDSANDPLLLARLSERFLALAERSDLSSREGVEILSRIEGLPFPFQRAAVVNATLPFGMPGRGVLSIHRERVTRELVNRLVKLGLNLNRAIPMEPPDIRTSGRVLYGGNIYHLAALEGNVALLKALPIDPLLANARNSFGETPVITALKYASVASSLPEVVEILVSKGARLEERDESGRHSFHYCLRFSSARTLTAIVNEWSKEKKMPLDRFDIESGIAYSLLDASAQSQATVRVLTSLLAQAPREARGQEPVLVAGLIDRLSALVPRDGWREIKKPSSAQITQPTPLDVLLRRLCSQSKLLSREFVSYLTSLPLPGFGRPLLEAAYLRGLRAESLRWIVRFGAKCDMPFNSTGLSTLKVEQGSLLHHAFNEGRLDVAFMLLEEAPQLSRTLDLNHNTPLHIYLLSLERLQKLGIGYKVDESIVERALAAGCEAGLRNDEGISLNDLALRIGSLDALEALSRHGAPPPARDAAPLFQVRTTSGQTKEVSFPELLRVAKAWRAEVKKFNADPIRQRILEDGVKILQGGKSVYVSYLYFAAAADMLRVGPITRGEREAGDALVRLAPQLLFHQPQGVVDGLWNAAEWVSDHSSKLREEQRHFNEAEMMLLLNYPRQNVLNPRKLNPLTRALTSVSRLFDLGRRTVPYPFVWNLARIGLYTHGFHLLVKVDTETPMRYEPGLGWQRSGKSLLEQRLDLVSVPPRSTDSQFGRGFLLLPSGADLPKARLLRRSQPSSTGQRELWKIDPYTHQEYSLSPDTMMEFRRGYLLVSNPAHGTLIIRNSSKIFGRDVLRHPAYWSPKGFRKGFTYNDLLHLTPEQIETSMGHILAPNVALNALNADPIYALLRQLDVVRDLNRRLKFETTTREAFSKDQQSGRVVMTPYGGHNSSGFRGIVEFLRERLDGVKLEIQERGSASKEVPDLGFVMPFFPPWITYRFSTDGGEVYSRLAVNEEVLEVLEGLVSGTFTGRLHELDRRHGVSRFLQEAGFDTGGELVLLSSREV